MENRPDFPQGIHMEEVLKLAATPQGQALLAQLKNQHGKELETAMAQAQAGNYEQVKRTLADFLSSPAGKSLMQQLRGNGNG